MSTSPFYTLIEALKKASDALCESICMICAGLCTDAAVITDTRNEIERLEAEALALENAEAAMEAVPFDVMLENLKKIMPDEADYWRLENIEWERKFWHRASTFARSRMASRAQAFARQMEHQKARQAMKRRKLLHAEGHFPDIILLGGKEA